MEYTFENNLITVTLGNDHVTFFQLDPSLETGLPEHAVMIEDFADAAKLQAFVDMLADNPNTAFINYLNSRQ